MQVRELVAVEGGGMGEGLGGDGCLLEEFKVAPYRFHLKRRTRIAHAGPFQLMPKAGPCFDAAGQNSGYAFGTGWTPERLAVFETDRLRHLSRHDRHARAV